MENSGSEKGVRSDRKVFVLKDLRLDFEQGLESPAPGPHETT
jgi:hypothetical protein